MNFKLIYHLFVLRMQQVLKKMNWNDHFWKKIQTYGAKKMYQSFYFLISVLHTVMFF